MKEKMKKGKEKLEEVNIMQGIDFKSNQARMREQIKKSQREQKKEAILCGIIVVVIVIMTCTLLCKTNKEFMDGCTSKGYSKNYCLSKS